MQGNAYHIPSHSCSDTYRSTSQVLLPPHTAQLYECLLAEESAAKQNSLQEEYEYLHRLKEHVIKKCLKLSRWKPSPLRSFVEIHAPDDFGSRELDAWGRETTKRTLQNCGVFSMYYWCIVVGSDAAWYTYS